MYETPSLIWVWGMLGTGQYAYGHQWRCYKKNPSLATQCLKANTWETSDGWKGKVALFRKPATWEGGELTSKDHLRSSRLRRVLRERKGKIAGATCWPACSQYAVHHFMNSRETCWHQGYSLLWSGQTLSPRTHLVPLSPGAWFLKSLNKVLISMVNYPLRKSLWVKEKTSKLGLRILLLCNCFCYIM